MDFTWLDARLEDGLKYPYTLSERIPKKLSDIHGRNIYSLLASLSCFGHRIMLNQYSSDTESNSVRTFIPTVTRFCENATQPDDFRILFENIPPEETKSRVIVLSSILERNAINLILRIEDMLTYEHIIFVHPDENEAFSIYYFVPSKRTLDLYFIGQNNMQTVDRICNTIMGWYIALQQSNSITIRQRLQTSPSFPHNPTVFAFILATTLHAHANYLDLNSDTLAIQQILLLPQMMHLHDTSFGSLSADTLNRRSHPFLTKINPKEDNPEEVQALGWSIIDVNGDGNCGYYSIILGLENLGITTYSPNVHSTYHQSMDRSMPWQFSIMNLRRQMKTTSLSLVESIFSNANAHLPWREEICPLLSDVPHLSDEFLCDDFTQSQYFDWSLSNNADYHQYQLSAIWGYIVAASLLRNRFIVYMRSSVWDGERVTYQWTTITVDPLGDLVDLLKPKEGLHRITDQEFRSIPTIEVMYTTGTGHKRVVVDKHYRFLRRVLCDDYAIKRIVTPTQETLRMCIRNEINHTKGAAKNSGKRLQQALVEDIAQESTQEAAQHEQTISSAHKRSKQSHEETKSVTEPIKARSVAENPRQYENLFNQLYLDNQLTHSSATRLYFQSSTKQFYMKANVTKRDPRVPCHNINEFDPRLVQAARDFPNKWVGPSLGDTGFGEAPYYLRTGVVTIHQQHSNPYCLSYSLASALFYCDSQLFRVPSEGLIQLGTMIADKHFDAQIQQIIDYMETHVPLIGRPTLFGRRTKTHSRKLREMTWDDLFLNVTPFPTIVIPKLPSGQATHAFCVVDDLIFDSTSANALKLCHDSVKWLFREVFPEMHQAIRFNQKVSPKNFPIRERYTRRVQYNWRHPTNPNNNA